MIWAIIIGLLLVIGFVLDREVYFYEGVHLGPRVQAWLYDRWSKKYDEGKRASQLQDDEMLAGPLLEAVKEISEPFVLDFATGTGRLSCALLNRPDFAGRIIALDLSQGMLEQAASKLSKYQSAAAVELLRHPSLPLPFPDSTFDVVCALEVLELFPGMEEPLRELARILRPGGILLTSRGTEESGRKARIKSKSEFVALLESQGFESVEVAKWWRLFDRVTAVKSGSSQPVGPRRMADVLRCGSCGATQWKTNSGIWKCGVCRTERLMTSQGILLN